MIDTKELRKRLFYRVDLTLEVQTISELLDRLEETEKDIALKEIVIDTLGSELNAVANERDALRTALEKIADWDSAWGPYPETNEAWRAMAIVTAREAVPQRKNTRRREMTDIVERIKDAENATHALFNYIFQDAREEIERLRIENETLRAEVIHIKEVEFPRKAQAVADGWRDKCERLEAKIEAMEQQEPVMWANSSTINSSRINKERGGCGDQHTCSEAQTTYHDTPLYALPGAKGEKK